jgi:hypothetical protein
MNQIVMNILKQKVLGQLSDAEAAEHQAVKRAVTEGWVATGGTAGERRAVVGISNEAYENLMAPQGRRNRLALQDQSLRQYSSDDAQRSKQIAAISFFANAAYPVGTALAAQLNLSKEKAALPKAGTQASTETSAAHGSVSIEAVMMYHYVVDAITTVLAEFKSDAISDKGIVKLVGEAYVARLKRLATPKIPDMISKVRALQGATVPKHFAHYHLEVARTVVPLLEAELKAREAAEEAQRETDRQIAELAETRRLKIVQLQKVFEIRDGTLDLQPGYWPVPTEDEGRIILQNMKHAFARATSVVVGHLPTDYSGETQYICMRSASELDWTNVSALRSLLVVDRFGLNNGKVKFGSTRMMPEMTLAYFWAMNTDGRADIGIRDGQYENFKNLGTWLPRVYANFIGDGRTVEKQSWQRLSKFQDAQTALGAAARWALNNANS